MAKSSRRRLTTESVMLIYIELLIVSAFVLAVLTLVAGRYANTLQKPAILTFDTTSAKTFLTNQGVSPGSVQDWYEPHYLSVCKGSWQSASTHLKDKASTICTAMAAGYTFSLPELLAADAGQPAHSPLFAAWSFAVLPTRFSYVCLTVAQTFIGWAMIDYFCCILATPRLTAETPLHWHRVGFIVSIPACITLIMSSAEITATTHRLLKAKPVVDNGVAWSTGGFYVLTWLATGLMCLAFAWSVVLAFKLRPPTKLPVDHPEGKESGYSDTQ